MRDSGQRKPTGLHKCTEEYVMHYMHASRIKNAWDILTSSQNHCTSIYFLHFQHCSAHIPWRHWFTILQQILHNVQFPPSFLHYSESFPSFLLVIYLTLSLFYTFLNYFIFSLAFFFQFPYTFKHGVKHSALRGKFSIIKKELNQRSMTHEQSGTDQKI